MPNTQKKERQAAGLAQFAKLGPGQAQAFEHVSERTDWRAVVAADLIGSRFPRALPWLAEEARLASLPSDDPLMVELHRACALYSSSWPAVGNTRQRRDLGPHPLVVLALARGERLYRGDGPTLTVESRTYVKAGSGVSFAEWCRSSEGRKQEIREQVHGLPMTLGPERSEDLSTPVYERARRNGIKRLADDLGFPGRKPWRKLPNALRDVAAWAVWRYACVPSRGERGEPYKIDLGGGWTETNTPEVFGIYSGADLLTLPAFASAFRGSPKSKRAAVYAAIERVTRLVRVAEEVPVSIL